MMMDQDEDNVIGHSHLQQKVPGRQVVERERRVLIIQGHRHDTSNLSDEDGEQTLEFENETVDYPCEKVQKHNFKKQNYYKSPEQESKQNRPRIKSQMHNPKQGRTRFNYI